MVSRITNSAWFRGKRKTHRFSSKTQKTQNTPPRSAAKINPKLWKQKIPRSPTLFVPVAVHRKPPINAIISWKLTSTRTCDTREVHIGYRHKAIAIRVLSENDRSNRASAKGSYWLDWVKWFRHKRERKEMHELTWDAADGSLILDLDLGVRAGRSESLKLL